MKILYFAFLGAAIVSCVLGAIGHSEAWAAAGSCFFAAIMGIVGSR